jgi:Predicted thioesterase
MVTDGLKTSSVAANTVYCKEMSPHETRVRVRYAETDQMGVV